MAAAPAENLDAPRTYSHAALDRLADLEELADDERAALHQLRDTIDEHLASLAARLEQAEAAAEPAQDVGIPLDPSARDTDTCRLFRRVHLERWRAFCESTCVRRYLRANSFDVDNAWKGLQGTLKWRFEAGVEDLVFHDLDTLEAQSVSGKMYTYGRDREGHVILCMHPGRETKAEKDHGANIKYLTFSMEAAVARLPPPRSGGQMEKLTLLIDFEGYSYSNAPPWRTSKATLDILSQHYPERLHRAYIVQPPWAFWAFWKLISPFIDPVTKAKVVMLRGSTEERDAALGEEIDPDQMSVQFGGTAAEHFEEDRQRAYFEPLRRQRAALALGLVLSTQGEAAREQRPQIVEHIVGFL